MQALARPIRFNACVQHCSNLLLFHQSLFTEQGNAYPERGIQYLGK